MKRHISEVTATANPVPSEIAGGGFGASSCSARPDYPPNVKHFIAKWQPEEEARQRAFWKEFRKAANAYANFKQNDQIETHDEKATN